MYVRLCIERQGKVGLRLFLFVSMLLPFLKLNKENVYIQ